MTSELVALLAEARAEMVALMSDSCSIGHPSGSTLDDDGRSTSTYLTLYSGRCRVQMRGTTSALSTREIGDQQVAVMTVELQVPVDETAGAAIRDLVTVLDAEFDPDLIGRTFRIASLMHKTHATARRFQCIEVTA